MTKEQIFCIEKDPQESENVASLVLESFESFKCPFCTNTKRKKKFINRSNTIYHFNCFHYEKLLKNNRGTGKTDILYKINGQIVYNL